MLSCELVTPLVSNFACFSQFLFIPFIMVAWGIWGMHIPTDPAAKKARQHLEQKYMFHLKRICGVHRTTSNAVISPKPIYPA